MPATFGSLFTETWETIKERWFVLCGAALVLSILPALLLLLGYFVLYGGISDAYTPYDLVQVLLSVFFSVLFTLTVLDHLRAKQGTLGSSVGASMPRFWRGLGLTLLIVFVIFGIILLGIVPFLFVLGMLSTDNLLLTFLLAVPAFFFFVAGVSLAVYIGVRWSLSYYALVEGKDVRSSLDMSAQLVAGNWWRTFGYSLLLMLLIVMVSLAIVFPVGMAAGTGMYFDMPWTGTAYVITLVLDTFVTAVTTLFMLVFFERYYRALKKEKKVK